MMITRVVQENMDERQHRIERLDRLQQPQIGKMKARVYAKSFGAYSEEQQLEATVA